MARRKYEKKNGPKKAVWTGFAAVGMPVGIDYDTAQDAVPHNTGFEVIQDLTVTGYKVAFSYDSRVDGFRASVTGQMDDNPNGGITLTATGGTVERAIFALAYKHYVMCGAKEWPQSQSQKTDL